ncbi:TetR/AcrR family transcriptional regulator [Microbacterium sp. gxy059]|uniref:TetR/AcrR family transcriptional regulator n=1 Tax=Microbacterium sp. gxy059 TaxID=2957199 RepID=UPI003D950D1B
MSEIEFPGDAEPPRGRSREATRARLLDAAAAVFAEVGLGAASVEAICERAGFTRGAFYSNFASKDELFLELAITFDRQRARMVQERVENLSEPVDPGNIRRIVEVLGRSDDDHFGVLLMTEITAHAMRDHRFAEALRRENEQIHAEVAEMVAAIASRGCLRLRATPEEIATYILGAWVDSSTRAVVAGLGPEEMLALRAREVGRLVELLIE